MLRSRSVVLLPLLALTLLAPTVSAANAPFRRAAPAALTAAPGPREHVAFLAVDETALAEFRSGDGGTLSLPAPDGTTLDLVLERVDVLAPGATVTYTDDSGTHAYAPDVTCFRGKVAGDPSGWAAITLTADGALGTVETHGERLQLAPVSAALASGEVPLVAFSAADEAASAATPFGCGVDADTEHVLDPNGPRPRLPRAATPNGITVDATRKTFNIAIDCDYEMYTHFASNLTSATAYVVSLMNVVSLIYQRDLEVELLVPYLNFWTTISDPYSATTTSTEDARNPRPSNADLEEVIMSRSVPRRSRQDAENAAPTVEKWDSVGQRRIRSSSLLLHPGADPGPLSRSWRQRSTSGPRIARSRSAASPRIARRSASSSACSGPACTRRSSASSGRTTKSTI